MAEIDVKFMKGTRSLAKAMGNKYTAKRPAGKKTVKKGKK